MSILWRPGKQTIPLKNLYLLRHAKSSWDDARLDDFQRPLATRGIKACTLMAAHIRKLRIVPRLILCSPARRARETYTRLAEAFSGDTEVSFEHVLYEAASQALLTRLRRIDDDVSSVLMIGHNPSLEQLALALTGGTETEMLARLRVKYPTLALASIEIQQAAWSSTGPGCGQLLDFVIPRDLEAGTRKK